MKLVKRAMPSPATVINASDRIAGNMREIAEPLNSPLILGHQLVLDREQQAQLLAVVALCRPIRRIIGIPQLLDFFQKRIEKRVVDLESKWFRNEWYPQLLAFVEL